MASTLIHCASCAAEIPADSFFCLRCGQAIGELTQAATIQQPLQVSVRFSSGSIPAGGFTPGTILIDRYRIVGLLGRGGMGEVYRADDLKLGQPVALKFLPKSLASDPVRRERFFAEVRITRQLAHPNICRVYDIAEVDGQHFLSMEYIDGEDLASLIKRIGYLSNEKALEITRQLAAGLAAAHEKGVLHRDLKPANIMIDGHGRVRITDFGLAVAAGEEAEEAQILGTPAYMAPEQFAGKGATTRSDIYALGLILYEIYSGKKAFSANTVAELRMQKESATPTAPSEIRQGLDPVVERLISRCLERDPRARPGTVAQLALALPGGDPLAAAIAAGETPSPEMVAASGQKEGLRPAVALAILLFIILGMIAGIAMKGPADLFMTVPPEKSPEILADRAREFLRNAGHSEGFTDSSYGLVANEDYASYLKKLDKPAQLAILNNSLSPQAILFWYRGSLRPITPRVFTLRPRVTPTDPPLEFSGDALVIFDTTGNLVSFRSIPPQFDESAEVAAEPDWPPLLTATGLDRSKWTPATPQWNPLFFSDTRAAWQGYSKDRPDVPMRIEAAAYKRKLVSFDLIAPWTAKTRMESPKQTPRESAAQAIWMGIIIVSLGCAVFLARRNLRLGRGDRRGAARLAVWFLCVYSVGWIVGTHHVSSDREPVLFLMFLGWAAIGSGMFWILYVALEPYVRRRWPQILVSWTRLLSGEWRDPLVGRDVLFGCGYGVVLVCVFGLVNLIGKRLGYAVLPQIGPNMDSVLGVGPFIAGVSDYATIGTFACLGYLCLLFVLCGVLRSERLAAVAFVLIPSTANLLDGSVINGAASLVFFGTFVVGIRRFGLLTVAVGFFVQVLLLDIPVTFQSSAWYSTIGYAALTLFGAIVVFGFKTSLGGRAILDTLEAEN